MVEVWKPAITVDLKSISATAFQEALKAFHVWSNQTPFETDDLPIKEGFCDITPKIAEHLLRRNKQNRRVSLMTVQKYARRMMVGEWLKTGQTIILTDDGHFQDGQHRLYACYFSGATFPCYVITSVPARPDLFAYIDDAKSRTAADALQTAGANGIAATIASAIKLAWRYENGALGIMKQPPIRPMDNIEVLDYVREHPDLANACHSMISNFPRAVGLIGNKGIAGFVAWKITALHGHQHLEDFMIPLGAGANLEEDNPILALRHRLQEEEADDYSPLHILALIIKAFNMHLEGGTVRRFLTLTDKERYPLFEHVAPQQQAAD